MIRMAVLPLIYMLSFAVTQVQYQTRKALACAWFTFDDADDTKLRPCSLVSHVGRRFASAIYATLRSCGCSILQILLLCIGIVLIPSFSRRQGHAASCGFPQIMINVM